VVVTGGQGGGFGLAGEEVPSHRLPQPLSGGRRAAAGGGKGIHGGPWAGKVLYFMLQPGLFGCTIHYRLNIACLRAGLAAWSLA
jgi:hypothetical protein